MSTHGVKTVKGLFGLNVMIQHRFMIETVDDIINLLGFYD
jgi:hypothetical protein